MLGVKIPRKAFTESGTLQNKCDLPSQRLKLAAQKTPARRKCMKGHGNKKKRWGTSLSVHWLRLLASDAGGTGSTPGQGIRIQHMLCGTAKNRKKGYGLFREQPESQTHKGQEIRKCGRQEYKETWLL